MVKSKAKTGPGDLASHEDIGLHTWRTEMMMMKMIIVKTMMMMMIMEMMGEPASHEDIGHWAAHLADDDSNVD